MHPYERSNAGDEAGSSTGELVKIKSHSEILETVNLTWMNRGMGFHPELVPFCGKTFKVKYACAISSMRGRGT